MTKPRILLIDDDRACLELFAPLMDAQGFEAVPFESPVEALAYLQRESVDLVVSDIQMPQMPGTELFSRIQNLYPDIPIILMTGFGSTEQAIQAVKQGAFHYFEKPLPNQLELFWSTIRQALAKGAILKELSALQRGRFFPSTAPLAIIGQSPAIRAVVQSIEEVAPLPVTVLIRGETGTGKDLVARAIHNLSPRGDRPLFAVSCTEFAEGVLESELFGHERGAFTGATQRKKGLFELADQGSLFLDEISEATAALQAKLLRVIETKTFLRVGGSAHISSDFRLLAASNRNLEEAVAGKLFRQDLFYRLNVYTIDLPPLRERKTDIPLLAEFYLTKLSRAFHRTIDGISGEAILALTHYEWPGNVRELVNVMERAVITCHERMITTRHLPFTLTGECEPDGADLNLKSMERFFIRQALNRSGHNKTKAARMLGVSRKTLIEKVKLYGLENRPNEESAPPPDAGAGGDVL